MKKFEILEHKADLKIRVFGKTKEELFSNALLAMTNGLRPELKAQNAKSKNIKVKSLNLETLLIDFLSEVLYLIQVNKEVYDTIKFKMFSDNELEAELFGKKIERFGQDIKAVTYHSLDIHQGGTGMWEAIILFDI